MRESGLAVEMEEYALGVSGIAAPLFDPEGRLVGAIGVKVPTRRFPFAFPRLARALLEVAQVTPHLRPEAPVVRLPEAPRPLESPAPLEAPEALRQGANLRGYAEAYRESLQDPEGFFGGFAREFHWFQPWEQAFDPETRLWFRGGLTNTALNAVDRHLPARARQVALVVLDGEGGLSKWTYREVGELSARLAGLFLSLGVRPGDRVALYLPTGLEAALAALAAARIGAVHVALPVGLGPEALRERLKASQARLLVAADRYYRRGQPVPLRPLVEEATRGLGLEVLGPRGARGSFWKGPWRRGPPSPSPSPPTTPSSSSTPPAPRGSPRASSTATGGTW